MKVIIIFYYYTCGNDFDSKFVFVRFLLYYRIWYLVEKILVQTLRTLYVYIAMALYGKMFH